MSAVHSQFVARILPLCVCSGLCLLAGLFTGGCQEAASATPSAETVSKAVDMVPESIKSTINGYLNSMTDVNKVLVGVNSTEQALSVVPVLTPLVSRTSEYTAILNKLSPEAKSAVGKSFGDRVTATNADFAKQSERIKANPATSSTLGGVLEKFTLFK